MNVIHRIIVRVIMKYVKILWAHLNVFVLEDIVEIIIIIA